MSPAIIRFILADLGRSPYDCRRADAPVFALAPFLLSVPLHDQPDEVRSIRVRNKMI